MQWRPWAKLQHMLLFCTTAGVTIHVEWRIDQVGGKEHLHAESSLKLNCGGRMLKMLYETEYSHFEC